MMSKAKRFWLGCTVILFSACACVFAQDDLDALLKNLGGDKKPAAEVKPEAKAPEAAPAPEAQPAAEVQPAAAPAVVEAKPEAKPEVKAPEAAPIAAAQPAAEVQPVVVPAVVEAKPEAKPEVKAPEAEPVAAAQPVAEAQPATTPAVVEAKPEAKPAEEVQPAAAPAVVEAKPEAKPEVKVPEAAPVTEAKPAGTVSPAEDHAALVSELVTLERIRRQSMDGHGYKSLEAGRQALRDGDYVVARDQFKQALDFIGNRPATIEARQEAAKGMSESYYREARLLLKQSELDKAKMAAEDALRTGHPQAARLLETIKNTPKKAVKSEREATHRLEEKDYQAQSDETRKRLRRSRQYYTTAEYVKALEECELILRDYPGNTEAIALRESIGARMKTVADAEFEATRTLMIKDVREAWTPAGRYAIESAQLPKGKTESTTKQPVSQISDTKTSEQIVNKKLREILIPEVSFRPPATIVDAIDFFKQASRDYDDPEIPVDQRGVNLILKLANTSAPAASADQPANSDPFAANAAAASSPAGVPVIQAISARFISLYDALKLVCDVTGMKIRITGNIVMIVPSNDPDDQLMTRSYNVLPTLSERLGTASSELASGGGANKRGGDATFMSTEKMGKQKEEDDWKSFFLQMGVAWPTGSSISYLSTIGKLRVTNTAEQLSVFEQVLEDLNVTPRLVEIEARFVEVSQKDLNSLGFEWLLNSDYSFGIGGFARNALRELNNPPPRNNNTGIAVAGTGAAPIGEAAVNQAAVLPGGGGIAGAAGTYPTGHNMLFNAVDGSSYSTGQRYLSTEGNPIAGEGKSINDNFMRVNAFLGNADVSMILHMLSQRSDTDLLSAPKVVTKSGQEAVMKVVTEYIYPSEFDVQISQQSSGGGSLTGGSSPDPIAIVEPQNFTMREVGIILQVIPEVSSEGQMINLTLNPQVVSEPVWKNYGTKLPKTTSKPWWNDVTKLWTSIQTTEYIELPMEQPFFSVRSVQTQLSIYNGATVVMGGLITEARKTIEDKVPFMGDLPYLGRLFRSRSEQSDKRNLLVFVTARLVDPAGRVVRMSGGDSTLMSGTGAGRSPTPIASPATAPAPAEAAPAAPAAAAAQ